MPAGGSARAVSIAHDVMVPMRDGVRLATDVYTPSDAGPGTPVLLYRTPYDKDEMAAQFGFARFFADSGYIVVQQDCRGCFKSEGDVDFLWPEAEDGYDTLAWIAAQPWGDADVGAWGTSWSAWTQTAMAALAPARLQTIVPMMSGSDAFTSSVRHAGALELRWIAWAFWHAAENTQAGLKSPETDEALIRPAKRFSDWLRAWPIRRGETQLAQTPAYERWAFELIEQTARNARWDHPSLHPAAHMAAMRDISSLVIGSWYDSYTRATFETHEHHRRAGLNTRLLVGPWLHGTATVEAPSAGGIAFPKAAAIAGYKQFLLDWFDRELRGAPAKNDAPVRLFVMGGGSGRRDGSGLLQHGGAWRDEHEWPLARTDFQRWHLHAGGALSRERPAVEVASIAYSYDPHDPVPTIGGNISSMLDIVPDPPPAAEFHKRVHKERTVSIVPPGGFDQTVTPATFRLRPATGPLRDRPDVLVFESTPLAAPMEATGPLDVHLFVSSDSACADFTAKLIDVYPPCDDTPGGFALNLSDSILRVNGLVPGETRAIRIELYPTSNVFAAGHRIRVDISSSNFPRFDRNPDPALNRIHCDDAHPSHIVLPVIPT